MSRRVRLSLNRTYNNLIFNDTEDTEEMKMWRQKEIAKLERKRKLSEEDLANISIIYKDMELEQNKSSNSIILDLHGKIFETTREILLKSPKDSYFHTLLSTHSSKNEAIIKIDINPIGFARILDMLNIGILIVDGLNTGEIKQICKTLKVLQIHLPQNTIFNPSSSSYCNHNEGILAIILLHNGNQIVTASLDCTLKIWNSKNLRCEATLVGHIASVTDVIQLKDSRICSCSHDHTVKIWNISTFTCEITLDLETPIWSVIEISQGNIPRICCIITLSNELQIWNVETKKCEQIRKGHTDTILCAIQAKDGFIYSSGYDNVMRVWSLLNGKEESCFISPSAIYCMLQLLDDRIAFGTVEGHIFIWNPVSKTTEQTLKGHKNNESVSDLIQLQCGRLCSASLDLCLKIWNISTGVCEQTIITHERLQRVIQLPDNRLCAAGNKTHIKVWKPEIA